MAVIHYKDGQGNWQNVPTIKGDPGLIQGVKVAGTELTPDSDGKVDVPYMGTDTSGVAKVVSWKGITIDNDGYIVITNPADDQIAAKVSAYKPITCASLDYAVKVGLMSNSRITTDVDKKACCSTIGAVCQIVKTTLDAVAVSGAMYFLGEQSTVAITLPSAPNTGDMISVVFYSGSTATSLTVSGSTIGSIPTPSTNQRVEMNMVYDGTYWAVLSNVMAVN